MAWRRPCCSRAVRVAGVVLRQSRGSRGGAPAAVRCSVCRLGSGAHRIAGEVRRQPRVSCSCAAAAERRHGLRTRAAGGVGAVRRQRRGAVLVTVQPSRGRAVRGSGVVRWQPRSSHAVPADVRSTCSPISGAAGGARARRPSCSCAYGRMAARPGGIPCDRAGGGAGDGRRQPQPSGSDVPPRATPVQPSCCSLSRAAGVADVVRWRPAGSHDLWPVTVAGSRRGADARRSTGTSSACSAAGASSFSAVPDRVRT